MVKFILLSDMVTTSIKILSSKEELFQKIADSTKPFNILIAPRRSGKTTFLSNYNFGVDEKQIGRFKHTYANHLKGQVFHPEKLYGQNYDLILMDEINEIHYHQKNTRGYGDDYNYYRLLRDPLCSKVIMTTSNFNFPKGLLKIKAKDIAIFRIFDPSKGSDLVSPKQEAELKGLHLKELDNINIIGDYGYIEKPTNWTATGVIQQANNFVFEW